MLRSLLLSAAILGAAEAMRAGVSSRPLRAVAARPSGVAMGLTFDESKAMAGDPNMKNYRKLSDALKEADVERRKEEEAAMAALKAEEDKRNRRKKKMEVMRAIPDSAPAGKVRAAPRARHTPRDRLRLRPAAPRRRARTSGHLGHGAARVW